MAEQQKITLNGKQYAIDELSEGAKAQLMNIRAVDQEIARLETLIAISKTARAAYMQVLGTEVQKAQAN